MMTPVTQAPGVATDKRRKIALFSDGTGNHSGKLFKTNVWRLYEALDLGPAKPDRPEQIALYSNGVGTSTFRPLALLGGVFGIGLKSNVLELYKYLCRNWRPGDEIYLFGFSRGAFTIRLLTGLIASQGILRGATADLPPDEDELAYRARAAYRAFAGETWPNRWLARHASRGVRAVRDGVLSLHRRLSGRVAYDPTENQMTDIAFVGVWDTVAAYGGPIIEITRGIDDWIWPLTMPNYQLPVCVRTARHALALDDERDAFQPLLWDEVREEMLVRWGGKILCNGQENGKPAIVEGIRQVAEGRLKQVWFAGMHADVGGGYPDESLSFVSLIWMIDELGDGLTILPEHLRRISSMTNVYGPLHDSRSGLGSYYRYQPRRIVAMLEPDAAADASARHQFLSTRSMRDPEIADRRYVRPGPDRKADARIEALTQRIRSDHGLLTSVRVHESVLSRVVSGTDNYAPVSLPQTFDIEFAKTTGLSERALDTRAAGAIRTACESASDGGWADRQAAIWDMVWWRRLQYFSLVALSVALVSMPLWDGISRTLGWPRYCTDDRCAIRPLLEPITFLSGGYARPWVEAFSQEMLLTVLFATLIVLLFAYGRAYELRLRGRARHAWQDALGIRTDADRRTMPRGLAAVRDRPGYQTLMRAFKWKIAPAVAGIGLLLGSLYIAVAAVFQLAVLPLQERQGRYCSDIGPGNPAITSARAATFVMDASALCTSSRHSVQADETYWVRLTVLPPAEPTGWKDGAVSATPAHGGGANLRWWADLAGIPFRRVIPAGWLQPMASIRPPSHATDSDLRRFVGHPVAITGLRLACDPVSGGYVGRLKADRSGTLSLFVNDAMLPTIGRRQGRITIAPVGSLYRNNRGRAVVQVWQGTAPPPVTPATVARCVPRAG